MVAQARDLAQPDALAQVTALKAKWQSESEAKLFEKPIRVFSYKGEIQSEPQERNADHPHSKVRERAVYVVSLECSHEPFKDDGGVEKDTDDNQPTPTPATTSPASSPTASP